MQHEINLAISFLFLNMAVKVLEIDKEQIERSEFKVKTPYIELLNRLITIAVGERRELRRAMQRQKVHVAPLYQEGNFSYYEIVIDRSKTVKCYFNPIIKKEVEKVIHQLIQSL